MKGLFVWLQRVKPDLGSSTWDSGGPVDVGGLSSLSLVDASRPPFLSQAIFSTFLGQEQPVPTVSQGYGVSE